MRRLLSAWCVVCSVDPRKRGLFCVKCRRSYDHHIGRGGADIASVIIWAARRARDSAIAATHPEPSPGRRRK